MQMPLKQFKDGIYWSFLTDFEMQARYLWHPFPVTIVDFLGLCFILIGWVPSGKLSANSEPP